MPRAPTNVTRQVAPPLLVASRRPLQPRAFWQSQSSSPSTPCLASRNATETGWKRGNVDRDPAAAPAEATSSAATTAGSGHRITALVAIRDRRVTASGSLRLPCTGTVRPPLGNDHRFDAQPNCDDQATCAKYCGQARRKIGATILTA